MMLLLVAFLGMARADNAPLVVNGLKLNGKLNLQKAEEPGVFRNNDFEAHVRSIVLPDEKIAKEKIATDFSNIQNLYKPRANPYEGQVSDLITCGKDLTPKVKNIAILGVKTALLAGGVSERKLFGACSMSELAFWGGYFEFYNKESRSAVEVRILLKKSAAPHLPDAQRKLTHFAEEMFQ